MRYPNLVDFDLPCLDITVELDGTRGVAVGGTRPDPGFSVVARVLLGLIAAGAPECAELRLGILHTLDETDPSVRKTLRADLPLGKFKII